MNFFNDYDNEIALYVHWPFCLSKCPYCDFNSHVMDNVDNSFWENALLKNLDYEIKRLPNAKLKSIFFGGGTPSLMNPSTVQSIIRKAKNAWGINEQIEITLEANPSSSSKRKFQEFKNAGINRISIGVQSFDDAELNFLGRNHSSSTAKNTILEASKIFKNLSIDLIYALPCHTNKSWGNNLTEILNFINDTECKHMSCYQLTIENNTPFKIEHEQGRLVLPKDQLASELYQLTNTILAKNGMHAYEISNYANNRNLCNHNLHIWNGGNYIGIGPGAHGRIIKNRKFYGTFKPKSPSQWLNKLENADFFFSKDEIIPSYLRAQEILMLGLRLLHGINLQNIEDITGEKINEIINLKKIEYLVEDKYISFKKKADFT